MLEVPVDDYIYYGLRMSVVAIIRISYMLLTNFVRYCCLASSEETASCTSLLGIRGNFEGARITHTENALHCHLRTDLLVLYVKNTR